MMYSVRSISICILHFNNVVGPLKHMISHIRIDIWFLFLISVSLLSWQFSNRKIVFFPLFYMVVRSLSVSIFTHINIRDALFLIKDLKRWQDRLLFLSVMLHTVKLKHTIWGRGIMLFERHALRSFKFFFVM